MGQPVVHFEIGCRDSRKTQAFFADLFGWTIHEAGPAAMIQTGGSGGIDGHITSLGHEPHNDVTVYVEVDDVDAYLDNAVARGGKALVGPLEIASGTFAWFGDPDGNIIGLWKPKRESR